MRKLIFWKISFFQNVVFLKRMVLCRSTCFEKAALFLDVFILNSYPKNIAVPKSNCRKELPILKKWLVCWIFAPRKSVFWKNNSCKKVTVLKKELLFWKTAAPLKTFWRWLAHLISRFACNTRVIVDETPSPLVSFIKVAVTKNWYKIIK